MAMGIPPDYLTDLLQAIEQTVVDIQEEFPRLKDADVEWVYEQLGKYYKAKAGRKTIEEPISSIDRRQDLMDEILNVIDAREAVKADADTINNPEIRHGEHIIPSLALLYAISFKRLRSSARFWRKEYGPKGYLNYIGNFLQ